MLLNRVKRSIRGLIIGSAGFALSLSLMGVATHAAPNAANQKKMVATESQHAATAAVQTVQQKDYQGTHVWVASGAFMKQKEEQTALNAAVAVANNSQLKMDEPGGNRLSSSALNAGTSSDMIAGAVNVSPHDVASDNTANATSPGNSTAKTIAKSRGAHLRS